MDRFRIRIENKICVVFSYFRIEREVSVSANFFLFVSKFRALICSKYWILVDFVEIESKEFVSFFLLILGRLKRVASCEIII